MNTDSVKAKLKNFAEENGITVTDEEVQAKYEAMVDEYLSSF